MGNENKQRACAEIAVPGNTPRQPTHVSSATLFGTGRELIIQHDGREYRLRLTRNDKLILTA
jgi:hemin uptake protein HemP